LTVFFGGKKLDKQQIDRLVLDFLVKEKSHCTNRIKLAFEFAKFHLANYLHWEIRGRFHQRSTYNFNSCGAQKNGCIAISPLVFWLIIEGNARSFFKHRINSFEKMFFSFSLLKLITISLFSSKNPTLNIKRIKSLMWVKIL